MATKVFMPHPLLRSCIQAYVYTDLGSRGNTTTFDLFPTGYSVLVYSLNNHAFFQDINSRVVYKDQFHFVGQLTRYRQLKITHPEEVCVVFKPTGAFRLFGQDQSCLANDSFSVRDMICTRTDDIAHRLEDAEWDVNKIIRILDKWFLKLWKQKDCLATERIEAAIRKITFSSGTVPIHELNKEIGMSKSSMEAHFKLKTGLTPKMYSRIIRFNQAYQQIKEHHVIDWQELIYRYNYYDQAHFIHEFKTFFGYTPSQVHSSIQNLASIIKEQSEQGLKSSI